MKEVLSVFHLKVSCLHVWVLVVLSQCDFHLKLEVSVRSWNNNKGGCGSFNGRLARVIESVAKGRVLYIRL